MTRLLLILSLMLAAPTLQAQPPTITIFAAASLTDALGEVAKTYEAEGRGRVVTSFASSSDLARQIEQGAPADIFISADRQWADYLDRRGLIDKASRIPLLSNQLVLVAPAGSGAALSIEPGFPLAAALGEGRLAVGDPDHVPAGIYARQALESLGVWNTVENRLARAGSVRAALLFVERADCPLGIVYRSDTLFDAKVRVVGVFPAGSHPPIVYPAARVMGRDSPGAAAFLQYLVSPQVAAIFKKYGFEPGPKG